MLTSAMATALETGFPYLFFSICVIFAFGILISFIKKRRNSILVPPGPFALPVIGHLHLLNLATLYMNLSSKHGPFMLIRTGSNDSYVVSNDAVAKEVYRTHDLKFSGRPNPETFADSFYKETALASIDYGKYYLFIKKTCIREVFSNQQVARFVDIRREGVMDLLRILVKKSEQGDGCDVGQEFTIMANKLIMRMTMSINGSEMLREAVKQILEADGGGLFAWEEAFSFLLKYDFSGAGKRMKAIYLNFDALLDGIVLQRQMENQAGGKRDMDLLDTLVRISEDKTSEVKLTKDGIKGILKDFMVGELLNHPNALKKVQDEIDQIVGLNRIVEESDIPKLRYLLAVIKETLRLHPVLPFVFRRCVEEDSKIIGFPIPIDATVIVNLYAINGDPNVWENADAFVPERFLTNTGSTKITGHYDPNAFRGQNLSYLPFEGGRRGCPAIDLATPVMQIALAALIQCFDWKIKGAEKVNMEEASSFFVRLAHPLVCYPILRVNPALFPN